MTFVSNPRRDAHATFAGFVFQVNVTILRWLSLKAGEHLELEAGEDIDLIREVSPAPSRKNERLVEQLKQQPSRSLTLRSTDALEAIANFCDHRRSNPGAKLRFRYLTTTSIGREHDWTGALSAIETWEKVRTGEMDASERVAAIAGIHKFLVSCSQPSTVSDSSWNALTGVLSQPDLSDFAQVIGSFEWAVESGDHAAMEVDVRTILEKSEPPRSPEAARTVYRDLFAFVLRLLCASGDKRLTTESSRRSCRCLR